ncbi:unnamed protein product [Urochloa humidicola]
MYKRPTESDGLAAHHRPAPARPGPPHQQIRALAPWRVPAPPACFLLVAGECRAPCPGGAAHPKSTPVPRPPAHFLLSARRLLHPASEQPRPRRPPRGFLARGSVPTSHYLHHRGALHLLPAPQQPSGARVQISAASSSERIPSSRAAMLVTSNW